MTTTPEKITLKFLFQNHEANTVYPKQVATTLRDCQVIFLEAVSLGQTNEERQAVEDGLNFVLTAPSDPEQTTSWQNHIERLQGSDHPINRLVVSLAGSNLRLFLVDADPSCDFFPLFETTDQLHQNLLSSLKSGQLDDALRLHRLIVAARAELHQKRENLVKSQVETILADFDDTIKRVAILQGSIHQPIAALFSADQFNINSFFFGPEMSPEANLWLKKRQGVEISDFEYQKSFLSCYLLPFAYDDESARSGANPTINGYLASLIEQLTSEQCRAALDRFGLLFRQKLKHYKNLAFNQAVSSLLADLKFWVGQ